MTYTAIVQVSLLLATTANPATIGLPVHYKSHFALQPQQPLKPPATIGRLEQVEVSPCLATTGLLVRV